MTYNELSRENIEDSEKQNSSIEENDSLDWAKEAYERLKKQQQEKKLKELAKKMAGKDPNDTMC